MTGTVLTIGELAARLGVLNGWPPFEPSVPAVDWWIAALRAAG